MLLRVKTNTKNSKKRTNLLFIFIKVTVQSLDPHAAEVRNGALQAITQLLHVLVKHYPMVSFNQDTQRLAVGLADGQIYVYDIKTACRVHVLQGHKGSINALSFANSGKTIASYSVDDATVRIWTAASTFFGFNSPHCTRTFPGKILYIKKAKNLNVLFRFGLQVSKLREAVSPSTLLDSVRLLWTNNGLTLIRGWDGSVVFADTEK